MKRRTSPLSFLERAERLVSGRSGIVQAVSMVETSAWDPRVHWAHSRKCDTTPLFGSEALAEGNAASVESEIAVIKALGESIERYCAAAVDPTRLRLCPRGELDGRSLSPDDLRYFEPEVYEHPDVDAEPFEEHTPIRWIKGNSLVTGEAVWLPAALVYIPYQTIEGEARVIPGQISTGLACHCSQVEAQRKALLEVVERDAFMLRWHRAQPGDAIEIGEIDEIGDEYIARLLAQTEVDGYERHIRRLTCDIDIPIILMAFSSRGDHLPYTIVGAGASIDPVDALRLALEEGLLSLAGIGRMLEGEEQRRFAEDFSDVVDLRQHILVHAMSPTLRPAMARFLDAPAQIKLQDLTPGPASRGPEALAWLVSRVEEAGYESFAVDLTTPDVAENGFDVVRVITPGLQPLDIDHRARHLATRRLADTARAELCPFPHPFP